jgi:ABC-type oligopeptide transport system substrate-binding subunit
MRAVRLVLVALAWALVAGPASSAPDGKALDYADRGYVRLDPRDASTRANDERLIQAVFECLTRIDAATGNVVPAAAERWALAPDGRSWTFTLRADGAWSDGKPVTAHDFVRAWRRIMDPEPDEPSPWRFLFRPIKGAATILDSDFSRRVLDRTATTLSESLAQKPQGLPGADVRELVLTTGLKSVPGVMDVAALRRLVRWGEDRFSPSHAQEALEALKAERRKRKAPTFDTYDAWGVSQGPLAKDDRTLVIETDGWAPYLPALVARGAFAPFPEAMKEVRDVGTDPSAFVGNGPFVLHERGARVRRGAGTPSIVHLKKSPTFKGPSPAKVDEIRAWTDEGTPEELRRVKAKQLHWLAGPDVEYKKDLEATPGWRTRPAGSVVFLRFRCDAPPFENKEARRAFAALVDRAALAKRLWPGADVAERIVPPGVKGAAPGVRAPSLQAAQAKKAFADAGLKPDTFPYFDLRFGDDMGHDDLSDVVSATWKKQLGVELGVRIEQGWQAQAVLRAGTFEVFLSGHAGAYDDAGAYLDLFASTSPDGGLGWKDEPFDLFLAGARDVDAAAAAPDALLAAAKSPTTRQKLEALKASANDTSRAAARQALLGEAEQRLLDELVVVPLIFPRVGEVLSGIQGIGTDAAWANCAFVGSLREATVGP